MSSMLLARITCSLTGCDKANNHAYFEKMDSLYSLLENVVLLYPSFHTPLLVMPVSDDVAWIEVSVDAAHMFSNGKRTWVIRHLLMMRIGCNFWTNLTISIKGLLLSAQKMTCSLAISLMQERNAHNYEWDVT